MTVTLIIHPFIKEKRKCLVLLILTNQFLSLYDESPMKRQMQLYLTRKFEKAGDGNDGKLFNDTRPLAPR